MARVVLIVNPFATAVTDERVRQVEQVLGRVATVTTLRTQHRHHAVELARDAAADADALFVFSGDGGFNEALNGVPGPHVPIGFIPGGGTSVLPRALEVPRDPLRAVEQLADAFVHGRTRRISVGRVNGRRFGFGAGIGLDAEAVRRIDARGRGEDGSRPGDLTFLWTVFQMIVERRARFEPALEVKGHGRAAFLLVANVNPYTFVKTLPLRVTPEAVFEAGLDFVAPVSVRPSSVPRLALYAATGRGQTRAADVLYGHDLERVEATCDAPMPLQADGEDLGDVEEAVFESEREAVSVLV